MSLFACCLWWFVLGLLLGWLLNWLLSKWLRSDPPGDRRDFRDAGYTERRSFEDAPEVRREAVDTDREDPPSPTAAAFAAPLAAAAAPAIDINAARAAGISIKHADDLTVVEGIGPKINELLCANGIDTFAKLADASEETVRNVLAQGGPKFKLADPRSWGQQARLASENRWDDLRKLQDDLVGGVNPFDVP